MSSVTNSKTNTATKKETLEVSRLETVVITSASKHQTKEAKTYSSSKKDYSTTQFQKEFTMQSGNQNCDSLIKNITISSVPDFKIQESIPIITMNTDKENNDINLEKFDGDTFQMSVTMPPKAFSGVSEQKSSQFPDNLQDLITKEIKYEIDFDSRTIDGSNDMKDFQDEIDQSGIPTKSPTEPEKYYKNVSEELPTEAENAKEHSKSNSQVFDCIGDNLNQGSELTTNIIPICDITTNDTQGLKCGKSLYTALTNWNFCLLINIVVWLCFVSCLTAGLWNISFNGLSSKTRTGDFKNNTTWVFWMMGTVSFLMIGILVCWGLYKSKAKTIKIVSANPEEIRI